MNLKAIFSARGAFVGSYHFPDCDQVVSVVDFDDVETYEKFRTTLKKEGK